MAGILRAGKFARDGPAAAVAALTDPLLTNRSTHFTDEEFEDSHDDKGEDELSAYSEDILPTSMSGNEIVTTVAVSLLVAGCMAASASAMVAVQGAAVFLMGGLCILNSPTVAERHFRIVKSASIRRSLNDLRKDIGLLKNEVDFLSQSVDDLQAEADTLVGLEQQLSHIAQQQGVHVKKIVDLVTENEDILSQMKSNLKSTFVSKIASVVMRSDTDNDMKIDMSELPLLALRIQTQLYPFGIKLDTAKFEAMIKEDNDISNIMKFCGELLFQKDDSNDDSSLNSELTFDFESFCKSLHEEDGFMDFEEKASMATIDAKYSKGSVDVARGKRMTLLPSNSKKDVRRKTIMKEVKKRQTIMQAKRKSGKSGHELPTRGISVNKARPGLQRNPRPSFTSGIIIPQSSRGEF